MLGMLKDGAFFRLVKLEGDSSFQLQPLANSHIEKLEEENKRLKRLLRDAECQLNREKHKTCMSHSKQKHFHTRYQCQLLYRSCHLSVLIDTVLFAALNLILVLSLVIYPVDI
jgi:hypothetical protein